MSTIYPISNEKFFELFEVGNELGVYYYCLESKLDSIKAYYVDISNQDVQKLPSCLIFILKGTSGYRAYKEIG